MLTGKAITLLNLEAPKIKMKELPVTQLSIQVAMKNPEIIPLKINESQLLMLDVDLAGCFLD